MAPTGVACAGGRDRPPGPQSEAGSGRCEHLRALGTHDEGAAAQVRAGSACSQSSSASGAAGLEGARRPARYSCPRCTQGRSVRCVVAFTATVTVPTRIRARAAQNARKIRQ